MLKVSRDDLFRAVVAVKAASAGKTSIPILGTVRMSVSDGEMVLTCCDTAMMATARIPCDGGDIYGCVSADTIADISKKLPAGSDVSIDASTAGRIAVKCGRSRFTLPTLDAADFPAFTVGDAVATFLIAADDLAGLINATRFAVSTDTTRWYLNGVYLTAHDGRLRMVATDGHRLAVADGPDVGGIQPAIIPRTAIESVRRSLGDGDVTISLYHTAIGCRFGDGSEIATKLIDGTFPDYQRVIPVPSSNCAVFDRAALIDAVERVAVISDTSAVKIGLDPASCVISAVSANLGEANESVDATYAGKRMDVGFNWRYLLDIARAIHGASVRVRIEDPGAPALIDDGSDAPSATYVLMPMRI